VVRAGGQPIEVVLFHHAIADALFHAPRQQRLQRGNPRLEQVDLADGIGPTREHRMHGIQAVHAQFAARGAGGALLARDRRVRRTMILLRARRTAPLRR